jgi:hypothetical protein
VNRRRRQLTVIVVVAALAAVVGLAAGRFVRSPASVAAETAPPPLTTLTAQVERRAITQTIIARGETLISGRIDLTPGAPPDGMQSVVTDVLARTRAQVHSGQVLLEVAERPMFILRGEIPMYRDIEPGDSGRDVVQLQAALRDLGWSIWDLAGEYGGSTQSAVLNQYRRMGYEPPRAEPTPIEPDDSTDTSSVDPEDGSAQKGAAKQKVTTPLPGGPIVPLAECFFVPKSPLTVTAVGARTGKLVEAPAISLSTSALKVRADVNPADGEAVRVGQRVRIQDESGELDVRGRVSQVGGQRVDESGAMSIPVTITPKSSLAARWTGQGVRVSFPTRKTANNALVVPIAAVFAGVDGRTTVVRIDAGGKHRVAVGTGMRGDGYVEVRPETGGRLDVGDDVLLGQG